MPSLTILTGQLDSDLRWCVTPDRDPQRTRTAFNTALYTVQFRDRAHLEALHTRGCCEKIHTRVGLLLEGKSISVGLARDDRGRVPVGSLLSMSLGEDLKSVPYPIACLLTDPHTYGLIFEAHTEGAMMAPVPTPQVGEV